MRSQRFFMCVLGQMQPNSGDKRKPAQASRHASLYQNIMINFYNIMPCYKWNIFLIYTFRVAIKWTVLLMINALWTPAILGALATASPSLPRIYRWATLLTTGTQLYLRTLLYVIYCKEELKILDACNTKIIATSIPTPSSTLPAVYYYLIHHRNTIYYSIIINLWSSVKRYIAN